MKTGSHNLKCALIKQKAALNMAWIIGHAILASSIISTMVHPMSPLAPRLLFDTHPKTWKFYLYYNEVLTLAQSFLEVC